MKLLTTHYSLQTERGTSLIEILVTMAIFVLLAGGIYFTFANILEITSRTRLRTLGTSLLNKEIEILRNVPYDQIGVVGGFPVGVLNASKTVMYENNSYVVKAYVRNIDDVFDGKQGETPNDTAPADYKIVELEVSCPECPLPFVPLTFTTWIAPQNLESSTKNGSLFVNVFDSSGIPISNVDVVVKNTSTSPTITIIDTTNVSGVLQLVDIPTSTNAYQITVSKTGYSTAKTYQLGLPANPNPIQPHATVASQLITDTSFQIDKVSTLTFTAQDYVCSGIASTTIRESGSKLIGSGPDVVKVDTSFTTDSTGKKTMTDVEWDNYTFFVSSTAYQLAGFMPLLPLTIAPNTSNTLTFVLENAATSSLLVTATDASSSPLADVSVNIQKSGTDLSLVTGERFIGQTNWAVANSYNSQDGNIDDSNPTGVIHILKNGGIYPTSTNSYLISNTFDLGTTVTTLRGIDWTPKNQPALTTLQFQLAANNDDAAWNYKGPDGTANTYFTASSTLGAAFSGSRYIRYKVYLNTINENVTPNLQDVQISFSSDCIPTSQAFFRDLPNGTYTITATKSGYTTATSSASVSTGWQEAVLMFP